MLLLQNQRGHVDGRTFNPPKRRDLKSYPLNEDRRQRRSPFDFARI